MSVEFEEDNFNRKNFNYEPPPKFAGWLISHGIVKDLSGANKLQVGLACVFFALALYVAVR